jgi:hypothetical protein
MKKNSMELWSNWIGIPGVALFVFSMLVYPWFDGPNQWAQPQLNWAHVQLVWDKWQTFNAAALAFVASLIALNISRIKDEKQRARDFLASKAFLPDAFSELTDYFRASANTLDHLWNSGSSVIAAPASPTAYRDVFKDCIRHATPEVSQYLAKVLVDLQVHQARLAGITTDAATPDELSLLSYMLALGKLKVAIDKQYEFARGEGPFNPAIPIWDDFKNAYSGLNLHLEDYAFAEWSLQTFTEKHIAGRLKKAG